MPDESTQLVVGDAIAAASEERPRQRRRWFLFGKRRVESAALTHCENCGAALQGHWCGQCGQAAVDYRRSFRHVIRDVLDSFLNWDSKFTVSVGLLIARPWYLTNEFLRGRRVPYVHPLRLYLLASVVFFFVVNYMAKSININTVNLSSQQRADIRADLANVNLAPEIRAKVDQALAGVPISPQKRAKLEQRLQDGDLADEERRAIADRLAYGDLTSDAGVKINDVTKELPPDVRAKVEDSLKRPQHKVVVFDAGKNEKPDAVGQWLERRAKEKMGEQGSKMGLFITTLFSNLPYMMLCCIPLFAFVLKILYVRKGIFYIDHLVYALHIHSFAYVAAMLIGVATQLAARVAPVFSGWLLAALIIAAVAQVFLSIRRVYRQGWFMTVLKFCFGGILYLVVLVFAVAATFFATLAMP
jgi:hypothetical protein